MKFCIKNGLLFIGLFSCFQFAFTQTAPLFDSEEVLELVLGGDIRGLLKDRGEESPYHKASINYKESEQTIAIPLKIKTRGHFRKLSANCKYPPILLNFAKATTPENSIFLGQDKLKLVTPCQGDTYVVHEYLVYKLYNILTPRSFKARLVKVSYQDTVKNKTSDSYYGMLLEDSKIMTQRIAMNPLKRKKLPPQSIERTDFLRMAVFQYMIGNTDWSIQYQQNIKLATSETLNLPIAIPYDFDHAGIVRAPYANPAPELKMNSTLQRRYRGHCIEDMSEFTEVFKTFNDLKDKFYAVYENNPLLDEKYQARTIKFLDQFYETISDPDKASQAFSYPCKKSGTGNVVIKGLKKDD